MVTVRVELIAIALTIGRLPLVMLRRTGYLSRFTPRLRTNGRRHFLFKFLTAKVGA